MAFINLMRESESRARRAVLLLLGLAVLLAGYPAAAQPDEAGCWAEAVVAANLRSGPGMMDYGVVDVMADGTRRVVGRSESGDWYALESGSWVSETVVELGGICGDLPIVAAPERPEELELLESVPLLPTPGAYEQARAIFLRGQARPEGRPDPRVFAKVGDCNTESNFFFFPLDYGMYRLGPYAALQPTIDFFAGSFAADSAAAKAGYTTYSVLDPLLANPELCLSGESPLTCEYRRRKPAVALIMLGANDARYLTLDEFNRYMREIVEVTLAADIVPVLSTFTARTDQRWTRSLAVNAAIVTIAREYDVPLVNLWRAARDLPSFGLIQDSTRLTHGWQPGDSVRVDLDAGQAAQWGHAMNNLLKLQALDKLRRAVLDVVD